MPSTRRFHNRHALAYVYFENEPGRRAAGEPADQRRSAAHRRQHRQAAGFVAPAEVLNAAASVRKRAIQYYRAVRASPEDKRYDKVDYLA